MYKIISNILIILILINVFFSGCLNIDQNDNNPQSKDSDGDGYPDKEDDFPLNPDLHLKESFAAEYEGYKHGEVEIRIGNNVPPDYINRHSIGQSDSIGIDWKYIEWNWSIQPDSDSIRKWFTIELKKPSETLKYTGKDLEQIQYYREYIDYKNFGEWAIIFRYLGGNYNDQQSLPDYINVTYEVYKFK